MTKTQKVQAFAWGITLAPSVLAFVAWGDFNAWKLGGISSYQLFPLFGLLAFSIMWAHYMASVARQHSAVDKKALAYYFEATSFMVLVLILAHPGLLSWQLWRDGFGLPPGSDLNYVVPSARWAILFAFTGLSIFLIYEFRRFYQKRPWWKYVQYASDAAMVLIYFHALKLGGTLMSGWYRGVWYVYGISLLAAFVFVYKQKFQKPKNSAA
jgi:hypothetical protein